MIAELAGDGCAGPAASIPNRYAERNWRSVRETQLTSGIRPYSPERVTPKKIWTPFLASPLDPGDISVSLFSAPAVGRTQALRRRVALAAALLITAPLLAIAGPTGSALAVPATIPSVPGGPVILDGNDPGDHPSANMTSYIRGVYTNLDANIAPGYSHNGKVAVVGPCVPILNTVGVPGQSFDSFATVAAIRGLFNTIGINNYKIIHICSNDEAAAVDLTAAMEAELALWGFAITTHVNRGGGLFSTGHGYAWLRDVFPALVVNAAGIGNSYLTPDGAAFFQLPNNTFIGAVSHYNFSVVPNPPLKTLLTESSNSVGRLVAIGGIVVRFPQIFIDGPTVADVGSARTYTLTAATADGVLLPNNAYSYTISGVTGSAGTGTGTTDANGQAAFSITGNARGTTTIRVRLGISANTAGGSQVVTTWVSLASAPGLTSAVDSPGTPGSVDLTWTAPTSAGLTPITDYLIETSVDGTAWTVVPHAASTATSYTVTGLNPAGTYQFRVSAINSDGPGALSNVVTNPVPGPQVITFPQPADTRIDQGPVVLTASSDSALAVAYVSNSTSVCTVSGTSVTLVAVGTCSITASQPGGRFYTAASPITRTFQVTPVPLATPAALTSAGVYGAGQSATAPIPAGGSVTLLTAAAAPATTVSNADGTYTIDPATGVISFAPIAGFVGTAAPVTYQVTDAYSQVATNTYTPTVAPPALAAPAAQVSTGVGVTPQTAVLPVPAGGSVTLLDAALAPATSVTSAQGTYTLDVASATVTFVAVSGFTGAASPVTFRITDMYGQNATNTYTPTVTAPAVGALGQLTSTGAFGATQSVTQLVPAGSTVSLIDANSGNVTAISTADGAYTLDPATGVITFAPAAGFVGVATPAAFRVTDAYAQSSSSTYTPTVYPPAPTPPVVQTTTGAADAIQSAVVVIPAGGALTLLDSASMPVTVLTIPGQGTFALDVTTGTITFVPESGFVGRAATVTFRVTDQYSQALTATYTVNVADRPAAPAPAATPVPAAANEHPVFVPTAPIAASVPARVPAGAAALRGSMLAPALSVINGREGIVPVQCMLSPAPLERCDVTIWASVSGRQIVVGRGSAATTSAGGKALTVRVKLTALGRALAAQPGGVRGLAGVAITPRGMKKTVRVTQYTQVVSRSFVLVRPVFFDTGSSRLRASEARYLTGLRRQLNGVRTVRCIGYTDAVDTTSSNTALGRARAQRVCAFLVTGTRIRVLSATMGETAPQASNATRAGRALNRRTQIRLNY